MDKFKGEVVHTHDYKYSAPYKNKTAIVVGIGNSGIDAAVDLSHVTSPVSTCSYITIVKNVCNLTSYALSMCIATVTS